MNRITTALLAALEALIVVAIGVGIALVPLTILWATHFGLAVDWLVFWRGAVDIWLLGNGVDLTVQLDQPVALALGLAGADAPFALTIAPLGFALLAVLLGVRTGRRAAGTADGIVGVVAAILTYGLLSALLAVSAGTGTVTPSLLQAILLPTLVYAAGVLIGASTERSASAPRHGQLGRGSAATDPAVPLAGAVRRRYFELSGTARAVIASALPGGAAAVAGILAVSGVAVAILILVNYATIIGLYETLQAGIVGGITLTLAQLALIPNLVIWAAAWFVGPGVAVGIGTSVSPVGTVLGPVPGLPLFGALPGGSLAFGFLGLIVPVVIGFACAVVIRQRMTSVGEPAPPVSTLLMTGLAMGVVAGVLLGLLAWWSSGALGPGRLAQVGPDPLLVGAIAAAEVGIAACLGLVFGGRRDAR
ncbi:DUF6350 family protein [Glaciibacter superstes]|uniref:cell division protein PerM n=1 Tax=Glaciibacter superstes TaxID=501023 RepID=UPI0003B798F4|nr:DUF6350 family protein [Glaciibacter superstes]